jgi:hypothetical protein
MLLNNPALRCLKVLVRKENELSNVKKLMNIDKCFKNQPYGWLKVPFKNEWVEMGTTYIIIYHRIDSVIVGDISIHIADSI